jgi:hypothetical protein
VSRKRRAVDSDVERSHRLSAARPHTEARGRGHASDHVHSQQLPSLPSVLATIGFLPVPISLMGHMPSQHVQQHHQQQQQQQQNYHSMQQQFYPVQQSPLQQHSVMQAHVDDHWRNEPSISSSSSSSSSRVSAPTQHSTQYRGHGAPFSSTGVLMPQQQAYVSRQPAKAPAAAVRQPPLHTAAAASEAGLSRQQFQQQQHFQQQQQVERNGGATAADAMRYLAMHVRNEAATAGNSGSARPLAVPAQRRAAPAQQQQQQQRQRQQHQQQYYQQQQLQQQKQHQAPPLSPVAAATAASHRPPSPLNCGDSDASRAWQTSSTVSATAAALPHMNYVRKQAAVPATRTSMLLNSSGVSTGSHSAQSVQYSPDRLSQQAATAVTDRRPVPAHRSASSASVAVSPTSAATPAPISPTALPAAVAPAARSPVAVRTAAVLVPPQQQHQQLQQQQQQQQQQQLQSFSTLQAMIPVVSMEERGAPSISLSAHSYSSAPAAAVAVPQQQQQRVKRTRTASRDHLLSLSAEELAEYEAKVRSAHICSFTLQMQYSSLYSALSA